MKTPRQILIDARKLIEQPKNWTRGHTARDKEGIPVASTNEAAVCWCGVGALAKASGDPAIPEHEKAYQTLKNTMGEIVSKFNDTHTHPEVLAAFDRAIESLT